MGGCKIASLAGPGQGGNAWPRSPVVGILGRDGQALPFGERVGERPVGGGEVFDPLAYFRDLLPDGQGELVTLGSGGGLGFGRAQRRVVLAGVAAAEFGVGGHGQVTLAAGGRVPVGPVVHHGGEHGLALPVGLVQGLVAVAKLLLLDGVVVLAAAGGGGGFGVGAQAGQAGVPGGGADLAELVADVLRCPGGFGGVSVAQVQQQPVGHAADVGPVDGAEGGEGLVPGGPHVGGGRGGFGADGFGGVVVAGEFPPGADGGGAPLPVQPVQRVRGDRAEGGDCPGQGVLGGVLADPVLAGVHQRGDLGEVGVAFGVGDARGPARTTARPGAGPGSRAGSGSGRPGRRPGRGIRPGPVR